jgi:glutathione S-transferase
VTRGVDLLAADLGERTWCHAERYSLADIALGCCLGWLGFRHPSIDWRGEHPVLARHFERVMSRPAFADTVPSEK